MSGTRRNYVINELNKLNIDYKYFEIADNELLNKLYNCLDLYVVASKVEAYFQAIDEYAFSSIPIISTDVGVATELLSKSIFNMENYMNAEPDTIYAYEKALEFTIPTAFDKYRNV